MPQSPQTARLTRMERVDAEPLSFREKLRERFGPRAMGIAVALLLEALLILMFLTISPTLSRRDEPVEMTMFDLSSPAPPAETPAEAPAAESRDEAAETPDDAPPVEPIARPVDTPPPPVPAPVEVVTPPVPWIELSPEQMTASDNAVAARSPAPAARTPAGPVAPASASTAGRAGDSERVEGTGPNGEPLYAASWYRRPYDDELSGFLSTARGPGWGMIACRTVADYRVEDCVFVGESPQGSNIGRAVLAAAWQFRVRPPRIGGRPQVGEWVRIRIDYQIRAGG